MTEKKKKSKKSAIFGLKDVVLVIVILILALSVHFMGVSRVSVRNDFMLDSMKPGENVLLCRVSYGLFNPITGQMTKVTWGTPKRGDIILFRSEKDGKKKIMRILGLPGEKVSYRDGIIFINSNLINDPYFRNRSFHKLNAIKLPENIYFTAGDNRELDEFGGNFEIVSREQILGKILKK